MFSLLSILSLLYSKNANADISENYMENFKVSSDVRFYVDGSHRRTTDPMTPWETESVLNYLFSPDGIMNSSEENFQYSKIWDQYNQNVEIQHRVIPSMISKNFETKYTAQQAELQFLHTFDEYFVHMDEESALQQTYQDLYRDTEWLESIGWGKVISTTTQVVSKEKVISMEKMIENDKDYQLERYGGVKVQGGITKIDPTGDLWFSESLIVLNITDPDSIMITPEFSENYHRKGRNRFQIMDLQPLPRLDMLYYIAFASALYDVGINVDVGIQDGILTPIQWIPYYNGNAYNIMGTVDSWSRNLRIMVSPYEWLGEDRIYGDTINQTTQEQDPRIMVANLQQANPSTIPVDSHAITAGTILSSPPLQMIYSTDLKSSPYNNLPGSQVVAMTWYGRGLHFSHTDEIQKSIKAFDKAFGKDCKNHYRMNQMNQKSYDSIDYRDYVWNCSKIVGKRFLRKIITKAIHEAWKNEEIMGIKPGELMKVKDEMMIRLVVKENFKTPTFANHATPTVISRALEDLGLDPRRDISRNHPRMTPLRETLVPNGKPLITVAPEGASFQVDGYSVTWDVGIKWKFQIGFMDEAGITIYNVRLILPPTKQYPDGEIIPYLFRLSIPHFGSSYANHNLGGYHAALFLESHFGEHVGLVPGQNCRGSYLTLPIFRVRGITNASPYVDRPIWYSQYAVPGAYPDPFAKAFLGIDLPFNEFPLDRRIVQNGIVSHGVCIEEVDAGNVLWHLYSAQRLRTLRVFGATISDVYNVVNSFEFMNDGKIKVAERLHGKPAVMSSGIMGAGGAPRDYRSGVSGGFAPNHLHWHVVAMEPMLGKDQCIKVSDLDVKNDDSNWYGLAFHRTGRKITHMDQMEDMRYRFDTMRHWEMEHGCKGRDSHGGLMIKSPAWGPIPLIFQDYDSEPIRYSKTQLKPEHTFKSHWWLSRNVWVRNADRTRGTNSLLSPSKTPDCHIPYNITGCWKDETIGNNPVVYAIMKVYHSVINEEIPIQNGFTSVELEIWPHNLLGFNPNILIQYMSKYNQYIQNSYRATETVYVPPYEND